jgi:predicted extracellular nuclease
MAGNKPQQDVDMLKHFLLVGSAALLVAGFNHAELMVANNSEASTEYQALATHQGGSTDIELLKVQLAPHATGNLSSPVCADPATPIARIQGSGPTSPLVGQQVVIEAVVTADLQASHELGGFFLQQQQADTHVDTSEGIFIFERSAAFQVGDRVRVSGRVSEYFGLTQIDQVSALTRCAKNIPLPPATALKLPLPSAEALEATEGMRVSFSETLTVNEVYNLGRFGEFTLSRGRRSIPTDVAPPGKVASDLAEANRLNQLLVDDGSAHQNPDPVKFPAPGLNAKNSLRIGSTLDTLTGVIHFAFGSYRLIPTVAPRFNNANPRTAAPLTVIDSDLRIVSFNLMNFFNGDGVGGAFPTDRGATNPAELARQTLKLVAALLAIDADILALVELENDGFTDQGALAYLLRALNAQLPANRVYHLIAPEVERLGADAIGVGLLYRPDRVEPVNSARLLSTANSPTDVRGLALFNDKLNRPALAQTFVQQPMSERFTLVVNHLKSKSDSNCANWADCDQGQGAYNLSRTRASQALNLWLRTDPTDSQDSDFLIIGDLNAYSLEDPITGLTAAGFEHLNSAGSYSYVYRGESGSLDHALASPSLAAKALAVQAWHINSDEPRVLDYNQEYKSPRQSATYFAPDPYRSSDHDPLVLDFGFDLLP